MTTFQFDECSDSPTVINACNQQGLARAKRFSKKHKGLKDPEMLAIYMGMDGVLLTQDCAMIEDHEECVPCLHPGIVMVGHSEKNPQTVTERSIRKIIGSFKESFHDWHTVSWSNSIVKITESTVEAGFMTPKGAVFDLSVSFGDGSWQDGLRACLARNAARQEDGDDG
jgi:hypothetical protein